MLHVLQVSLCLCSVLKINRIMPFCEKRPTEEIIISKVTSDVAQGIPYPDQGSFNLHEYVDFSYKICFVYSNSITQCPQFFYGKSLYILKFKILCKP